MKKFANMTEFAKSLGLARGTVSYILNGNWKQHAISKETALRVIDAASKNGFVPSVFGKALRGKVSTDVAVIFPANAYDHLLEAYFKLIAKLEEHSLSYLVFPLKKNSENLETLSLISNFGVRKIILFSSTVFIDPLERSWWMLAAERFDEIEWLFYDLRFEFVSMNKLPGNVSLTGFNRRDAFITIFNRIAGHGFKQLVNIGFNIYPQFKTELLNLGLKLTADIKMTPGIGGPPEYPRYLRELENVSIPSRKTAVFCASDILAMMVIRKLKEKRIAPPADYGIVSWGALDITAEIIPSLTSLEMPTREMLADSERFATESFSGRPLRKCYDANIRDGGTLPDV